MPSESDGSTPRTDTQFKPPPSPPVVAAPPAPTDRKIAEDQNKRTSNENETSKELAQEFKWVEFGQLVLSGVLAVVGIIALIIYHGQLEVMRGQLGEIVKQFPEIKKSSDAARDAADAALKQGQDLELSERAWIAWNFAPNKANGMHDFTLADTGKTAAIKVHGHVMLALIRKGERYAFGDDPRGYPIRLGVLEPTIKDKSGLIITESIPGDKRRRPVVWSKQLANEVQAGNAVVAAYGKIYYHDIFNSKTDHWINFCYLYESNLSAYVPPSGRVTLPKIWQDCADANSIDARQPSTNKQ